MIETQNFKRESAALAYILLHEQGYSAFQDKHSDMSGSRTLNTWHDRGLVKITHTPTGFTVKTYKKYANEARRAIGVPFRD